jgi:hypothetical protein
MQTETGGKHSPLSKRIRQKSKRAKTTRQTTGLSPPLKSLKRDLGGCYQPAPSCPHHASSRHGCQKARTSPCALGASSVTLLHGVILSAAKNLVRVVASRVKGDVSSLRRPHAHPALERGSHFSKRDSSLTSVWALRSPRFRDVRAHLDNHWVETAQNDPRRVVWG